MDWFLPEFDHEMAGTRSVIELAPDSLLPWKAHDSLHTIGWNASHLADTLSWIEVTLTDTSFDIDPPGGPKHETPVLDSTSAILESFDTNLAKSRSLFQSVTDEELQVPWTLLQNEKELFTMPRAALIKSLFINHMIHHRAFLVSYLRMNDITCPGLYG